MCIFPVIPQTNLFVSPQVFHEKARCMNPPPNCSQLLPQKNHLNTSVYLPKHCQRFIIKTMFHVFASVMNVNTDANTGIQRVPVPLGQDVCIIPG